MRKLLIIAPFFVATVAQAQVMVPPIEKTALVSPVLVEETTRIELNAKEKAALDIVRKWRSSPDKPRRAADGTVMYLFGASEPTLICTPLRVCAIRLQAGEIVDEVFVGDPRWEVISGITGSGPHATTSAIVKVRDAGVTTNLIITTDRRTYTIVLKSANHEFMPAIAFDYPDDQARTWADYQKKQRRVEHATTMKTGQNIANLDFGYQLGGDNPSWKPQRVFTDGTKTIIQFQSDKFADEAPVLVVIGKGKSLWSESTEKLVNYRSIGDTYVVDQVIEEAVLISGVGRQQTKVTITREKGK